MFLWLISQDERTDYDTYDSAVVVAASSEEARSLDPSNGTPFSEATRKQWESSHSSWASSPREVTAILLGAYTPASRDQIPFPVICASFNAG